MLQLTGVSRTYRGAGDVAAVRDVSLTIQAGEFCALVGPSGSGKSTLMNLIGLLDRPCSGTISLRNQDLHGLSRPATARLRNAEIGFVFQSFHLLPRLRAWENVALPLSYRRLGRADQQALALTALHQVGLADKWESRPHELSGGQRQRVAIARAVVGRPSLLLADEPTGSLDSSSAASIMGLFSDLNERTGVTVIMVTHDLDLAAACRRRIELLDGRVVGDSGARQ